MFATTAHEIVSCCRLLATHTDDPDGTTRTFLSPPMRSVHAYLTAWMERCGMTVRVDEAGNLRGVYPGSPARRAAVVHRIAPRHRRAGRGVRRRARRRAGDRDRRRAGASPLAVHHRSGRVLRGRRRALRGAFHRQPRARRRRGRRHSWIAGTRTAGRSPMPSATTDSIRRALRGPAPTRTRSATSNSTSSRARCSTRLGIPLAIVDAIAGQNRVTMAFTGSANHAGTTPMHARRDALAGAAEWIGRVERLALETPRSGRHRRTHHDRARRCQRDRRPLRGQSRRAAWRRRGAARCGRDAAGRGFADRGAATGSTSAGTRRLDQASVAMNPALVATLERAVYARGLPVHRMASGAGHDAMIMAARMPAAMLFLRSPGGISHHPDETVRRRGRRLPRWPSATLFSTTWRGPGCDRPRGSRRDGRHPERPASGGRGNRGRPHTRRVAGRRGGRRRDRRPWFARAAGRHRRARALQRTWPDRVGGRGHRKPGAGRRRRHAVLRHAAQFDAVHGERRGSSTANGPRSRPRRSPTSGCGAGWCRARSPTWPRWPTAASSDSKRSCAIQVWPSSRAPMTSRCSTACGKRRGSAGRSPCTRRAKS